MTASVLHSALRLLRPHLEAAGFSLTDGAEIDAGDAEGDHFEFRAGEGRDTRIVGVYRDDRAGEVTAELWWPAALGAYVEGSRAPLRRTWPASGDGDLAREIADQVLAWVSATT